MDKRISNKIINIVCFTLQAGMCGYNIANFGWTGVAGIVCGAGLVYAFYNVAKS